MQHKLETDSQTKSLLKTFSWRTIATVSTILIAWLLTGSAEVALALGGIEFFVKMFLFYIHERIWSNIR